jgi:hypothetical protein
MKDKNTIPNSPQDWLYEIVQAYQDAYETLLVGKLTGTKIMREDLFQLSPAVCLKFRGIEKSEENLKKATDAALSSYVATKENIGDLFDIPQMSFAFCYLASHFGLGLIDGTTLSEIMEFVEFRLNDLISPKDETS